MTERASLYFTLGLRQVICLLCCRATACMLPIQSRICVAPQQSEPVNTYPALSSTISCICGFVAFAFLLLGITALCVATTVVTLLLLW